MPGFNRTGPRGAGPMTGWGRGLCAPGNAPQSVGNSNDVTEEGASGASASGNSPEVYYGPGRGGLPRGRGRGFGGGHGRGRRS